MSRINKPKGLIRYTTENTLNGRYPERALSELLKRPKVILYGVIIAAITLTAVISFINRQTFSAEIARDRGALSQLNSAGQLENSYTLHLENQTDTEETYTLSLSGSEALTLEKSQLTLTLAGGEKATTSKCKRPPRPNSTAQRRYNLPFKIKKEKALLLRPTLLMTATNKPTFLTSPF
jgi:polyferredoxin